MQIHLTVDYLKALTAKREIWKDKREVEYLINEFDNVVAELVKIKRPMQYDRMVLFLQGLLVRIVTECQ